MEELAGEGIFLDESVGRQVVADLGLPWSEAATVWNWLASPPSITVARQADSYSFYLRSFSPWGAEAEVN